ncbi:MAG TPA: YciI family protein [Trebonia sp.]
MKVVNYATYASAPERIAALRPAHREYMARLHADGRLVAGGTFTDCTGALYIYEAGSLAAAEQILADDPYQIGGVFGDCRLNAWEIIKANPTLIG